MNIGSKETLSADVVVIGSGVTGLAAALTAAEGGAKVILFEKQRSAGGTSNFFEGTFAVESVLQREKYITYSRDDAFMAIMEYSHWRANARLVRAFVNESAETISWLLHNGVEFSDITINMPDEPRTYHVPRGTGAAVVKVLVERVKERGVDFRLEAPVKRIVREGERITGVFFDEKEQEKEAAARVVIIASGGYANNKEWIKKYTGFELGVNLLPIGNIGKMGDGIRMAWEIGADEEGIDVLEMYRVGPIGQDYVMKGPAELIAAQPDLWVNPQGERFCDEGVAFYETSAGNVNARFGEGYTYSIFDESIKKQIIEKGTVKSQGQDKPPGTRPVDFDRELKSALDKGSGEIFAADSVEGLSEQIGVVPAVLKATVDEYNRFCEKGHDDLFAKDPRYLRPLRGPRYYAVKARTIFLGTLGGVKINHKMEVVDKQGGIIPGLYAGGFDAGGMYGDSYSIRKSSGASSAFAINSGRIAAKNALKYLGK